MDASMGEGPGDPRGSRGGAARGRAGTAVLFLIVLGVAGYLGWQLLYEFGILEPARFKGYNLFASGETSEVAVRGGDGSASKALPPRGGARAPAPSGLRVVARGPAPAEKATTAPSPTPEIGAPSPGVGYGEDTLAVQAPRSCLEALARGDGTSSGLYTVDPDGPGPASALLVYCDMETDGGGWTLCLNSLRENPAPATDMTLEIGCAGWLNGHVRDCRHLFGGGAVETRHLIQAGRWVVNRSFEGRPWQTLPPASVWRRFGPETAREGEVDDGVTFAWVLGPHLGVPWHTSGRPDTGPTFAWYHTDAWGVLPVSASSVRCGGGPVVRKGARTWCADRYAIFVRQRSRGGSPQAGRGPQEQRGAPSAGRPDAFETP